MRLTEFTPFLDKDITKNADDTAAAATAISKVDDQSSEQPTDTQKIPNKTQSAKPKSSKNLVPVNALPGFDQQNELHRGLLRVLSRQKYDAKRTGKTYTVVPLDIWNMFVAQNFCCALTGVAFQPPGKRDPFQPSLDRKDSSRGYEPDNVQFVTLRVNIAKSNMTEDDFFEMCKQVVTYKKPIGSVGI